MPDPNAGFRRVTRARPKLPGSSVCRAERWKSIGHTARAPPIGRWRTRSLALDDLKAWADRGTKTSTSDPGNGTVLPAKRQAAPIPYAGKSRR